MGRPPTWTSLPGAPEQQLSQKLALGPLGDYRGGMFKKLLFLALIVGVGFLAAKKLRAA